MRGIFIAAFLVVALIVGILVVKDMNTETNDNNKRIENIDRARQAAETVNKSNDKIKEAARRAEQSLPKQ
jgi:large-conductance mechanosensitive channel